MHRLRLTFRAKAGHPEYVWTSQGQQDTDLRANCRVCSELERLNSGDVRAEIVPLVEEVRKEGAA
jgi:hypothetical protein